MYRRRLPKPTRLLASLLTASLFGIFTLQPSAQTAPDTRSVHPMSFGYDKAHEITINGTVQEVVSKHTAGSPAGLHLLVGVSTGIVDAHLGPFLTKDTQDALHTGTPVQIVGAMETLHGTSYLLARQVIFGGRLVTVRSENGFLVRVHGPRVVRSKSSSQTEKTSQTGFAGGAQ